MTLYDVRNVEFSYPSSERLVLDGASMKVEEGDVVTLLGCNGAGKSTLLNCMLGLLRCRSGEILLRGENLNGLNERQIAQHVGYVPQIHVPSFAYTVLEFVVMGCAARIGLFSKPGREEYAAARQALAMLDIEGIADRLYTEISGGQRQQATIARAIAAQPAVVLFDEPTAHLDFANQLRVLRIIKGLAQQGYSVVFTTHNPDHALLLGGKAALMDCGGRLSTGPVDEIITEQSLKEVYGGDLRLEYIESLGRRACLYPSI